MDENPHRRWLVIAFFFLIGLLFVGFIHLAIVGPRSMRSRQPPEQPVMDREERPRSQPDKTAVILALGQVTSVGKIKMIYRGRDGDRINIDVIIPELDPEMAYHHAVHETDAKRGLKLGGQDFKLISAGDAKLHLNKITPQ
jgi:hypothetical protein